MPLDTNIALQYRPPQFENQLANYSNFMQIQNAGNQNRLAEIQYRQALQAESDDQDMRSLPPNATLDDQINKLNSLGKYELANKLKTNALSAKKTQGEITKQEADQAYRQLGIVGGALGPLLQNPSRQAVMSTLQALEAQGVPPPPIPLPADDAQLPEWVKQVAALTDKGLKALEAFSPKAVVAGDRFANSNALAGPVGAPFSGSTIPMTAAQVEADQRMRSEGALNRGVQVRGQNMLDTRIRETPHYVVGSDESGQQMVTPFTWQGMGTPEKTGAMNPSWMTQGVIAERQIRGNLEKTTKPHLDVLNAYQRFEQIKGTGDNAQANQFLAQQLMQMSRTGQRVIPKAELERILGSGELGNDWINRAANMVTQMAAGVRTPTIDKRLSDLVDAMAKGSADRIGQEIQNTRARTPPGVDAARIVGATPTIYGRFIITPTGKVHTFKSSAEAQAKLQEASQIVGQ